MDRTPRRGPVGFRIIGAFKCATGFVLFAAGVGLLRLLGSDVAGGLERLVASVRLDPQNHLIHSAIAAISGVKHTQLRTIGFGTFFYAALYLTEGIGLVLERRWAGYLTVVATGSLVPFEGYEVFRKTTVIRIGVLVVNVAIVVYLIWSLRREARAGATGPDAPPRSD